MAWVKKIAEGAYKTYWYDVTGTQRSRTFRKLKYERPYDTAHDWAEDVERDMRHGVYRDPAVSKITLAAFVDHFLDTEGPRLKPSTMSLYSLHARLYVAGGPLGNRSIGSIDTPTVKKVFADWAEQGKGAATLGAVRRLMHRVFEIAVEEGRIPGNPVRGVRIAQPPQADEDDQRVLDAAELAKVAEAIDERYSALVWTLGVAGLRIGEASALRVKHVDLGTEVSRVRANSAEVDGVKVEGTPKTTGSRREVSIPPRLAQILRDHLTTYGNIFDGESYVFTAVESGQVRQSTFRKTFKAAQVRAGIQDPKARVHSLRHTAASLMAQQGFSLVEAGRQLGHSAQSMTDRYTALFREDRAEKTARLDAVFGEAQ